MTTDQRPDDETLWRRAAEGDDDAFAEIYRRHADRIHGYLFRRCASWAQAQDLTSVVFLEAWRRRREVSFDGGSVAGWLYGVAGNVLRSSDRSLRRYQGALRRLPALRDEPDVADDVAHRVDDEARMAVVARALERLPADDRELLSLSAWSDLSLTEIAALLDLPLGTVKSRLSRLRARLRDDALPPDGATPAPSATCAPPPRPLGAPR